MKQIGTCKYCGQQMALVVGDEMTEEEINELASRECNCDGAKTNARLYDNRIQTEANIKQLVENPEVADLLIGAIPLIQKGLIDNIKTQMNETDKINITQKDSIIRVQKVVTLKDTLTSV